MATWTNALLIFTMSVADDLLFIKITNAGVQTTFTEVFSLRDKTTSVTSEGIFLYETTGNLLLCSRHCKNNEICDGFMANKGIQKCRLLKSYPPMNDTSSENGWRYYRKAKCRTHLGYRKDGDFCFKHYFDFQTIPAAKERCVQDGGRLLRIQTAQQQQALANYLTELSVTEKPTVDGRRDDVNSSWRWSDGTLITWFHWAPNSPSQNFCCLKLTYIHEFKWNDAKCKRTKPFLCEILI